LDARHGVLEDKHIAFVTGEPIVELSPWVAYALQKGTPLICVVDAKAVLRRDEENIWSGFSAAHNVIVPTNNAIAEDVENAWISSSFDLVLVARE